MNQPNVQVSSADAASLLNPVAADLEAVAAMRGDSVRRLIAEVMSKPNVRADFYKDPRSVAAQYGLGEAELNALATVRDSLKDALGEAQLAELSGALTAKWYGPVKPAPHCTPTCTPRDTGGCDPGCNPDAMKG